MAATWKNKEEKVIISQLNLIMAFLIELSKSLRVETKSFYDFSNGQVVRDNVIGSVTFSFLAEFDLLVHKKSAGDFCSVFLALDASLWANRRRQQQWLWEKSNKFSIYQRKERLWFRQCVCGVFRFTLVSFQCG